MQRIILLFLLYLYENSDNGIAVNFENLRFFFIIKKFSLQFLLNIFSFTGVLFDIFLTKATNEPYSLKKKVNEIIIIPQELRENYIENIFNENLNYRRD